MKVSVWDTYVKRSDGKIMHFDILVPKELNNKVEIYHYGSKYLQEKIFPTEGLNSKRCNFCHIEKASEEIINSIKEKGYYIIEMANCN